MKYIEFRIFVPDQKTKFRIIDKLRGYGNINHKFNVIYGDGPKYWLMHRFAEIRKKEGKNVKIEWRDLI